MDNKTIIKLSLEHKQTDIVPYHIEFTIPALEIVSKKLNTNGVDRAIGNHMRILAPAHAWTKIRPGSWKDEFGTTWDRTIDEDIGNTVEYPVTPATVDKYKFPDPRRAGLFDHYDADIEKNKDLFILSDLGFSLFERAGCLMGMEDLLCEMHANPELVESFLDRIVEYNLAIVESAAKHKIDGIFFGDDWGQQEGLIMGPKLWRKLIKPRTARMYKKTRDAGLKVFIHSCGDVEEIFPDLIEIGVDVFNPFQPEAFDVYKIKKEFGDKISFFGGMSTQKTLPFGTPDDVKRETRKLLDGIGRNGGYIFSPAHATPKDVPLQNIEAMLEVLQNQ